MWSLALAGLVRARSAGQNASARRRCAKPPPRSTRSPCHHRARLALAVIVRIAIRRAGPLPYIPRRIVQTELICLERAHRRGLFPIPLAAASIAIGAVAAQIISPPIPSRGPRTGRIFPFRLRRQAIVLPSLLRQPLRVGNRVFPGDIDHWPPAPAPAIIVCLSGPCDTANKSYSSKVTSYLPIQNDATLTSRWGFSSDSASGSFSFFEPIIERTCRDSRSSQVRYSQARV